jgi:hypothetical protein
VSRTPKGDVMIAMKPYPEEGGAAYDAMQKIFAETLGAERYRAFLSLDGEQTEDALGRFGTAQRTLTVMRETGADGEVRYRLRQAASVTPENNSNYLSDRLTYEQLVHEVGALAKVLPADFLPRK